MMTDLNKLQNIKEFYCEIRCYSGANIFMTIKFRGNHFKIDFEDNLAFVLSSEIIYFMPKEVIKHEHTKEAFLNKLKEIGFDKWEYKYSNKALDDEFDRYSITISYYKNLKKDCYEGSGNFPKGYKELRNYLRELLVEYFSEGENNYKDKSK